MDNDTGALHHKKEQLYQRLQELSKLISGAINELKERRDKRNELTKTAQDEKQKRKDLSKIIKDKIVEVKTLRAKRGDRPAPVIRAPPSRDSRGRDDVMSPGKLKEEIARIERKLETSAMDFSEEQKLTKVLKEKKGQLAKLGGDADMDRTIRALSKDIDKLKKESDVAHEAVTKAAKESQEHHEAILKLSKEIEEWKTEETGIKEQYQNTKQELQQSAPTDLPMKKASKSKGTPAKISAEDVAVLKEKAAEVEQKVKDGKKLTTEDLLAFQAHK